MSLWGKLTGASDIITGGFDLIDKLHTSPTEMVEAKTTSKVRIMESYAPFKVAQRILAIMFTIVFLGSFLLCLVQVMRGADIDNIIALLQAFKIDIIELMIMGFYFGGGFIEGGISSFKRKKENEVGK